MEFITMRMRKKIFKSEFMDGIQKSLLKFYICAEIAQRN